MSKIKGVSGQTVHPHRGPLHISIPFLSTKLPGGHTNSGLNGSGPGGLDGGGGGGGGLGVGGLGAGGLGDGDGGFGLGDGGLGDGEGGLGEGDGGFGLVLGFLEDVEDGGFFFRAEEEEVFGDVGRDDEFPTGNVSSAGTNRQKTKMLQIIFMVVLQKTIRMVTQQF